MQAVKIELVQDHLALLARLLAVSLEQASLNGPCLPAHMVGKAPVRDVCQSCLERLDATSPFRSVGISAMDGRRSGYLQEMEVIQARRGDNPLPRASGLGSDQLAEADPPARPKRPPRKLKKEG